MNLESELRTYVPKSVPITSGVLDAISRLVDHIAEPPLPRRASMRNLISRHKLATVGIVVVALGLVPTAAIAISAIFPGQQWTNELVVSVPVEASGKTLSCELSITYQPIRAIPVEIERMDTFLQGLPWADLAQDAFDDAQSGDGVDPTGQRSFEALLSQDLTTRLTDEGLAWREGRIDTAGQCAGGANG